MSKTTDTVERHVISAVPLMAGVVWHICVRCGRGGYTLPNEGAESLCQPRVKVYP